MSSPRVSIVVLSYNGRSLTLDCIRSLLATTYHPQRIIVVDNASSDGSVSAIHEAFAQEIAHGNIDVIVNSANLGFAAGNNIGIERAMRLGTDAVLLLNNDTIVAPDLLERLVETLYSQPQAGIVGPMIYYFDPADRIWFAGTEVLLYRGLSRHRGIRQKDTGQFSLSECDAVTGCAMFIRAEVIRTIGLLDTRYPLYSEDTDYCMRARQAGYRMYLQPSAKVWHKISAATGGAFSWKKIRLRTWSHFLFLLRYARWYHWLTIPWFQLAEAFRAGGLVLRDRLHF